MSLLALSRNLPRYRPIGGRAFGLPAEEGQAAQQKARELAAGSVRLLGEVTNEEGHDMKKRKRDYEDDEREAKIITACALRIDGYRYADEHGLAGDDRDYTRFLRAFLADPNFDLPRGHLHGALFLLQRAYLKEDGLRWDSPEARVVRELFLALCREDPPEGYGDEGYRREWERRHRPRLAKLLEIVRRRHERTNYRQQDSD